MEELIGQELAHHFGKLRGRDYRIPRRQLTAKPDARTLVIGTGLPLEHHALDAIRGTGHALMQCRYDVSTPAMRAVIGTANRQTLQRMRGTMSFPASWRDSALVQSAALAIAQDRTGE
jgi:hypothetical protein